MLLVHQGSGVRRSGTHSEFHGCGVCGSQRGGWRWRFGQVCLFVEDQVFAALPALVGETEE